MRKPGDSDLKTALRIASDAHDGQTDKAGRPYIWHPIRVALAFTDERHQIVALLHDVIEDSDWTAQGLTVEGFAKEIVEAVAALTYVGGKGETRTEYYDRVKANPLALSVKLADIADNTDPLRTAFLDDETRDRLKHKYERALRALTS